VSEGSSGPTGVVFYLATYAFTNLGAFFAVMAISNRTGSDEISSYAAMGRRAPVAAAVLLFCLLSLTGLPPTAGFFAKVFVFNAAVQADLVWLAVVGVLNTVVSAFYYLGVARQMYLTDAEGQPSLKVSLPAQGVLALAAGGVGAFFIVPWVLIDAAQRAVNVFA
jgi:NADH-quinone oxidoreductase subunit N